MTRPIWGGDRAVLYVCLATVFLTLTGCTAPPVAEGRSEPELVTVAAARVTREDLGRDVSINGEFRPYQEVELHAKVAGYLKTISVDVGDHVQAGQVVATLEIPENANEAAQALASKRRAEADLVRARTDLARAETQHQNAHVILTRMEQVAKSRPNLIAMQELDDVRTRDLLAEGQIDTARASITAAQEQVRAAEAAEERGKTMAGYSRITSPFAGVVSKRYADLGALIQQGTASSSQAMPIVRISDISRLRVVLAVPESAVASIKAGSSVTMYVEALKRSYQGRVSRFADRLQDGTRTMETQVDLDNPRAELKPGMFATAVLSLERHEATLAVPVQSVFLVKNVPHVYHVDGQGRIEDKEVRTGLETPEKIEIAAGLAEGDVVVTGGRGQVRPGQVVKPKIGDK